MNASVARFLYFSAQVVRGEPVRRVVREIEASQHASPETLAALQWSRQLRILRHAVETCPFYRDTYRAAGIDVRDVRNRTDWSRLPIVEKSDLQEQRLRLRSRIRSRGLSACSSGSSGVPVVVDRSHESWAHAHANVIRGWHWHGLEVGEPYAYLWGLPSEWSANAKARLRDRLFNRVRGSAFDLEGTGSARLHRRLLERPTRFAVGYPSALARFAHELDALGLDGRRIGWRRIICTAEVLTSVDRQAIERSFGAPVFDSYGCAEAGVGGFECERGTMHIPVESVVVDQCQSEVEGFDQVLLTDLHNFRAPLIRYRVGDLVDSARPVTCRCGRGLPTLGRLVGRSAELIQLADGRALNPHVTTYLLKSAALTRSIREFQFVQLEDGRVELRLVPGPGWGPEARTGLHSRVRDMFGQDIALLQVETIVRSSRGKHLDFVRADRLHPKRTMLPTPAAGATRDHGVDCTRVATPRRLT